MAIYTAHEQVGYFCKDTTVVVDERLAYAPYAQAGIRKDSKGTHLISYSTLVCTISPDGYLSCTGTYSATTRKHINRFLKEVAPSVDYYDAKYCYEHNVEMNIYNKKLREIH